MAMTNDDYQHFVCIVAGDNPKKLMSQYDKNKIVKPYVVYKYKDASRLKEMYIDTYNHLLDNNPQESIRDDILNSIEELKEMSPHDFFMELSSDLQHDEKTGDAISTKNKDGKWSYYSIGKMFSIPFLTNDGRSVFQARKSEIDWNQIHLSGQEIYSRAWEMVMEGSTPVNDYETNIFENMRDKQQYFKKFENKENYVISNTSFWGYAFLSEKTGWVDAEDESNQFMWMKNYYDLFIKNLSDDMLLTIYECKK